jgi:3-deoxy-D-manno-octulosonic-acid transferase
MEHGISLNSKAAWPKGMGILPENRFGHMELFGLCDAAGLSEDQRTWVWGVSIGDKSIANALIQEFSATKPLTNH